MENFFQIFQDLHYDISFVDALLLMLKFASTIKSFLANKDRLFELAKIILNENCSAMLLKKLLKKPGDPVKFLIPCDFPGMGLSLPELTPTRMTIELADRSITHSKGVGKYVFVKIGKFHFSTDFVVVDFKADPRVPFILGRSFLRTGRALIEVYGEEITLWVNEEFVTFNLNQTTRYSYTYDDMLVNRINVIDVAREEYAQEMLGFSSNFLGGNPTSTSKPLISNSFPSLTPFEGSDFILEEIEQGEVVKAKSSIEEPSDLELKDLPSHLEYAYLEGVDKLPVIIAKDLKVDEKKAPLKEKTISPVLMEHFLIEECLLSFVMLLGHFKDSFETLKKKLTEAPILVVPDWNLPYKLMCDASDFAIGAILGQIYAFEKFRPYPVLSKSIVHMDHSALKYLLSKQDAKSRLLRWVLLLQEFDIIIRDKKGTKNLTANHLSILKNPHKDVFESKDIN
nr:reverse transcriptase domain-containing protein [Tanacetum cinerariifolium]